VTETDYYLICQIHIPRLLNSLLIKQDLSKNEIIIKNENGSF